MMKLSEILAGTGLVIPAGKEDILVEGICCDSREAVPGGMFVAIRGYAADGHRYIGNALEKGSAVIVCESDEGLADCPATVIKSPDTREALAVMASNFYGRPSEKLTLVGITGTNGKTTTVTLLYNLFRNLGYNCGLLSTIANYVGTSRMETENTTADPVTINRLMAEMVEEGCEYCFMEVSSIGMEQKRVFALDFNVGIFSNLTHDHLDYHKTFAEYLRCKKMFFDSLPKGSFAIVNADDRNAGVMVQNTAAKVVTYACKTAADHTCRVMEESFDGMMLRIDGKEVWTRLIGLHNAYNLLAIYTTAVCLGVSVDEALVSVSRLESAPGRLQTVRGPRNLTAIIDYAHTPDALENVLKTLRDVASGKQLVCVFGCGGDRDRTKRPEMGAVAEKYADRIVITSDNSRSESTEAIMEEIAGGLSRAGMAKTIMVADRRQAIRTALLTSPDGSAVLIAGKGHENYQIIGSEKLPFDEKAIVEEIFESMKNND